MTTFTVKNTATAAKDVYNRASLDVYRDDGKQGVSHVEGVKTTFYITDATIGSVKNKVTKKDSGSAGNTGSDPLLNNPDSAGFHNAYYFVINTSSLLPGKYTATINGFTDENEKTPYSRDVDFEITEPVYLNSAYTEVLDTGSTTVGTYYVKSGSTYVQSKFNTPKGQFDADGQSVYTRSGQPLY